MEAMDNNDADILAMLQEFVWYDSEYLVKIEFFRMLDEKKGWL